MTWLTSERKTVSLDAMYLSWMLGNTECTAHASTGFGVATKFGKVAAASYTNDRRDPIRYAAAVAKPRNTPTRIGVRNRDGMAGNSTRRLPLHLYIFWFRDHILARVGRGLHPEEAGINARELPQPRLPALPLHAARRVESETDRPGHRGRTGRQSNPRAPPSEPTQ